MIAQVARLSLDHERLHAERTAQLRELRASRVRIVAAATANVEAWNVTCTTAPNSGSSRSHSAFSSQSSPRRPWNSLPSSLLADAATEWLQLWPSCAPSHAGSTRENWPTRGLESALETFAEVDPTSRAGL